MRSCNADGEYGRGDPNEGTAKKKVAEEKEEEALSLGGGGEEEVEEERIRVPEGGDPPRARRPTDRFERRRHSSSYTDREPRNTGRNLRERRLGMKTERWEREREGGGGGGEQRRIGRVRKRKRGGDYCRWSRERARVGESV